VPAKRNTFIDTSTSAAANPCGHTVCLLSVSGENEKDQRELKGLNRQTPEALQSLVNILLYCQAEDLVALPGIGSQTSNYSQ
jgi:hypothetical protein